MYNLISRYTSVAILVLVVQVICASNLLANSHGHKHGSLSHSKHATGERLGHGGMGELTVPIYRISAKGVGEQIGNIVLKDVSKGLVVMPNLHSLSAGLHAFHIHENGNCGPGFKDGKKVAGLAAGPHFGHDTHGGHHGKPVGDLPELLVGENGLATMTVASPNLKTSEIAGRSIMIHAESEAAGSSARFACGVIPEMP